MPDLFERIALLSRRSKVTALTQRGPADCGVAALEMVLTYHGATNVRATLHRSLGVAGRGTTVHALVEAARSAGFDADAFQVSGSELGQLPGPIILHWRNSHFVVLEGKAYGRFAVVDPACGRRFMTERDFSNRYTGVAIAIEPAEQMPRSSERAGALRNLLSGALKTRDLLEGIALLALGAAALIVGAYQASRVTALPVAAGFGIAPLTVSVVCSAVWAYASLNLSRLDTRLRGRLDALAAKHFAEALQAAAPDFATTRPERFLEDTVIGLRFHSSHAVPQLTRVARIAVLPLLLGLVALQTRIVAIPTAQLVLACAAMAALRWKWRSQTDLSLKSSPHIRLRDRMESALGRPEDLMAAGIFGRTLSQWLRRRAAVEADSKRNDSLALAVRITVVAMASVVATILLEVLVHNQISLANALFAGVLAVVTVGLACSAASELDRIQNWLAQVRQIGDLVEEREIPPPPCSPLRSYPSADHVLLECEDLVYGETPDNAAVLAGVNLSLRTGEAVAIIGGSATGKTLLARILLSATRPTCGSVRLLGKDSRSIPETNRKDLIAGILDTCTPAHETIANFFRSTSDVGLKDIQQACADVGLEGWLTKLPLGLRTPIARGGLTLSSSEQRLLFVARLIAKPPRIAVLDATLDGLEQVRALGLARLVAERAESMVLLTARPDIVPANFRRLSLEAGLLRQSSPLVSQPPKACARSRGETTESAASPLTGLDQPAWLIGQAHTGPEE